jgi:4-hydroxy-4-methyl-2-oxoglutarate aldolase
MLMRQSQVIVTDFERPEVADVAGLRRHPVAAIADVAGKHHLLPPGLVAITPGVPVCGPVVTCRGADVLVRRAAIDLARPGDVLVVSAGGRTDRACFGAATAEHMRARGMAGIVVDGAVRDAAELRRLSFPTYAKAITARNYDYPVNLADGAVNVAVDIDGHQIESGDVIAADDDGVLIIPRAQVPGLAARVGRAALAEDTKWVGRLGTEFGAVERLRSEGYDVCEKPPEVSA